MGICFQAYGDKDVRDLGFLIPLRGCPEAMLLMRRAESPVEPVAEASRISQAVLVVLRK